jgi:hypothetical protein
MRTSSDRYCIPEMDLLSKVGYGCREELSLICDLVEANKLLSATKSRLF